MARIFPNGSGTTNVFPEPPAAAASTWTVAKEFDFTGMSNYTFGDNDTEALDSVDWVSRNQANSTSFAIVNGTGLKMSIENDKTSTTWYHTIQTAPILQASISDIVSGYNLKDTICVQALITPSIESAGSNPSQNYIGAGIVLSDGGYGGSASGDWVLSGTYALLTGNKTYYARYGGGTATNAGLPAAELAGQSNFPSFLELVFYPGTGWSSASSTDTSFQDPHSVTTARFYGNMETALPHNIGSGGGNTSPGTNPDFTLRPGNLTVGMYTAFSTNGGQTRSGTVAATFTKLRVLKRNY
jgi:hypothetical protein